MIINEEPKTQVTIGSNISFPEFDKLRSQVAILMEAFNLLPPNHELKYNGGNEYNEIKDHFTELADQKIECDYDYSYFSI